MAGNAGKIASMQNGPNIDSAASRPASAKREGTAAEVIGPGRVGIAHHTLAAKRPWVRMRCAHHVFSCSRIRRLLRRGAALAFWHVAEPRTTDAAARHARREPAWRTGHGIG